MERLLIDGNENALVYAVDRIFRYYERTIFCSTDPTFVKHRSLNDELCIALYIDNIYLRSNFNEIFIL